MSCDWGQRATLTLWWQNKLTHRTGKYRYLILFNFTNDGLIVLMQSQKKYKSLFCLFLQRGRSANQGKWAVAWPTIARTCARPWIGQCFILEQRVCVKPVVLCASICIVWVSWSWCCQNLWLGLGNMGVGGAGRPYTQKIWMVTFVWSVSFAHLQVT